MELDIVVEDTGKGIKNDELDKIFKPFVQGESTEKIPTGTGLGLSICKKIVELLDGEISAESELDKGSVFKVRLKKVAFKETTLNVRS